MKKNYGYGLVLLLLAAVSCSSPVVNKEKERDETKREKIKALGYRYERSYSHPFEDGVEDTTREVLGSQTEFDEEGRLEKRFTYDPQSNGLTAHTLEEWTYDDKGRVKTFTTTGNGVSQVRYSYDSEGHNILREVYDIGSLERSIAMVYDKEGNVKSITSTLKDGAVDYRMNYTYNEFNEEATAIKVDNRGAVASSSKLVSRTDTSTVHEVFRGEFEGEKHSVENRMDKHGNLTAIIERDGDNALTSTTRFKYDEHGLLSEVRHSNRNGTEVRVRYVRSKE